MQCKLSEYLLVYAHACVSMCHSTTNLQLFATAISSRLKLKAFEVLGIGADPH